MPEVNDEMKAIADYAIKTAREKYKVELDYSIQSISSLENILEKIYWGFYSRADDKSERGIVYNTAIIWGSYLGEFMRLKWGGKWILKDSKQLVSIRDIDFSPISYVYHKITGRVKTSVGDYIFESNGALSRAGIAQQREVLPPVVIEKPSIVAKPTIIEKPVVIEKPIIIENVDRQVVKKPIIEQPRQQKKSINKDLILAAGGIAGIIIIFTIFIIGFLKIRDGSLAAVGLFPELTTTNTDTPVDIAFVATQTPLISTSTPTITLLPTYTARPTNTPRPSKTPSPTFTDTPTLTPTETPTATETDIPWRSPTPTRTPTKTEPPPIPTDTPVPPTPVPIVIESCDVSPSSIEAGFVTALTFTARFSAPGYGFDAIIQDQYPGYGDCSASDDDGDNIAQCSGSSGMLPGSTRVNVLFQSSVGNCVASFQTP